jgi:CHASE3 domain sensor protein
VDASWLTALANYGALGGVSLWLMLRMEKKLDAFTKTNEAIVQAIDRLSNAIKDLER